jgi:transposase InsO family protein
LTSHYGARPEAPGEETAAEADQAASLGTLATDHVWSADFMSDKLYCRKTFRTFNVIDDFNRECLSVEIDTSITGRRLIRVFQRMKQERSFRTC